MGLTKIVNFKLSVNLSFRGYRKMGRIHMHMKYFQTNIQTILTNKNKEENSIQLCVVNIHIELNLLVPLRGKVTYSNSNGCSVSFSFVICKTGVMYLNAPFNSVIQDVIPVRR